MIELSALLAEHLPKVLRKLPPLSTWKDPTRSALVGLLGGGVALAIYFRSVKDGFFCFATYLAAVAVWVVTHPELGWEAGGLGWGASGLVAAMYGYYRAQTSNELIALRRGGRAAGATHAPQRITMG